MQLSTVIICTFFGVTNKTSIGPNNPDLYRSLSTRVGYCVTENWNQKQQYVHNYNGVCLFVCSNNHCAEGSIL